MLGNHQGDFESLARRYWAAWGDMLRGAAPAAGTIPGMGGPQLPPGVEAWQESLDLWTRLAHGGRTEANDAVGHFNTQARQWYARMQEVAARFAGQGTNAVDVARAWKEALGAAGENPFPEMLRSLRGHGLQGLEQWVEDSSPWLQSVREEGTSWLRMPAFGAGREQQERMQQLAGHMVEYQQASSAYAALMAKAQQEAFLIFENRLIDHEEPGRQLQSGRALFDLWVDAAEEAYADIALSPEFRDVYGQLVNAQMRVRGGVQRMVEDATAQLGMPTRSELDGAHRKLAQLEREVRRLRDALGRPAQPVHRARGDATSRPGGARRDAARPGAPEPVEARRTLAPARRRGAAAAAPAKRGGSPPGSATKTAARTGSSGAVAKRRAATPAAAPKKAARRASSARSGFGGAISGSVPRAPEPIAKKGAAKAAKTSVGTSAKPVKKGKR